MSTLTRREQLAGAALQGMAWNFSPPANQHKRKEYFTNMAKTAVALADAVIEELDHVPSSQPMTSTYLDNLNKYLPPTTPTHHES